MFFLVWSSIWVDLKLFVCYLQVRCNDTARTWHVTSVGSEVGDERTWLRLLQEARSKEFLEKKALIGAVFVDWARTKGRKHPSNVQTDLHHLFLWSEWSLFTEMFWRVLFFFSVAFWNHIILLIMFYSLHSIFRLLSVWPGALTCERGCQDPASPRGLSEAVWEFDPQIWLKVLRFVWNRQLVLETSDNNTRSWTWWLYCCCIFPDYFSVAFICYYTTSSLRLIIYSHGCWMLLVETQVPRWTFQKGLSKGLLLGCSPFQKPSR